MHEASFGSRDEQQGEKKDLFRIVSSILFIEGKSGEKRKKKQKQKIKKEDSGTKVSVRQHVRARSCAATR
jgi:hypothetical protein